MLSAYGVLLAVEEGAVELDQPAGPPGSTVRHLLAHASGLAFGERKVMADPGAKRISTKRGIRGARRVRRAQTGIEFAGYLREGVFEPLGMSQTALTGSAGHDAESTVDDLARFAAELLTPTLLAPATLDEATTVQFPGLAGPLPGYGSQRPNDWGLGFEIRKASRRTGRAKPTGGDIRTLRAVRHVPVAGPRAAGRVRGADRPGLRGRAKPLWREFSDSVVAEVAEVRRIGSA